MLNNQDDDKKYEDHEESEYHFSDDEVSYEVEQESPKATPIASKLGSGAGSLTRSKRMLIVGGAFLFLVVIVYTVVLPSSSVPSTEIKTASAPINQSAGIPPSTPTAVKAPEQPIQTATNTPAAVAPNTPSQTVPQESALASTQQTSTQPSVVVQTTVPATATTTSNTQVAQQPAQPITGMPAVIPVQSPASAQPPTAPTTSPATVPAQSSPVIVSSTTPPLSQPEPVATTMPASTTGITQTTAPTYQVPGIQNANAVADMMAAERAKLMSQLQADYEQKISVYAVQNKVIEEQMKTLNTRVAGLESQINQLLQAISRQNQNGASNNTNPSATLSQAPQIREPKVPFNVQAIIPGRAWLKSDNGETITVAEGDTIKNLGRITKIDPYDGVVEINTGGRQMALSYGNGS